MRITGKGIWGPPADPEEALRVLRRAVELGVDFIDTADSYGPFVSEDLIREALHPYDGVLVATKGGLTRNGPDSWEQVGRPGVPAAVRRDEPAPPRRRADRPVAAAPHRRAGAGRGVARRGEGAAGRRQDQAHRPVRGVGRRDRAGPQGRRRRVRAEPLQPRQPPVRGGPRSTASARASASSRGSPSPPATWPSRAASSTRSPRTHDATHAQLALAWLLRRSPVMLPIPGTGSVAHLEENCAAATVELTDEEYDAPHRRRAVGRAAGPLRRLVVMAQLRIGLAQVDPVGRRPARQRRPGEPLDARRPSRRAATSSRSPRWCSPATRRRTSCCGTSFVQASLDALEALAVRLADEGAGDVAVVVGYCGRTEQPAPALGRPAGEPQNSAAVLFGGRVVSPLRQAPPAELRRLRRVPLLRARRPAARRAAARRRRRDRRLRGPLAGGRAAAGRLRRRRRAGRLHQRLAVRARQGRPARAARGPPRGGGGRARGVRQLRRRPGRAGLRRRLARGRRRRRGRRPRAAVGGAAAGRRPRPRAGDLGRSPARVDARRRHDDDASSGWCCRPSRSPAYEPARADRSRRRSTTTPRCGARS